MLYRKTKIRDEKMQRLEFHISYFCLNNCIFCSEQKQIKKFDGQFVGKEVIRRKLKEFSQKGFKHISFTGGEPTFHPNLVEILHLAKDLNYRTYISSNGGLFYDGGFCRKILPYLDEICFSMHGHNAKLHDYHTRNKGSFDNLVRALGNIQAYSKGIFAFVNIVITRDNFKSIIKIIEFVSRYKKIKQIIISSVAPEGNGFDNFNKLTVPLNEIEKAIDKIIHVALDRAITIRFFGMPLCVLNGHDTFSNDAWWSPRVTLEKWKEKTKIRLKTTLSAKPTRKRIKTLKCRHCLKTNICGGVFRQYYKTFGDDELGH